APAEERRTLAVQSRRYMTPEQAADLGRLDEQAIARVREQAWPEARSADEVADALALLGFCTSEEAEPWRDWLAELERSGRAARFTTPAGGVVFASAERLAELELALPEGCAAAGAVALPTKIADGAEALRELVRSRLEALGPITAERLGAPLGLGAEAVLPALVALEAQGAIMRGRFTGAAAEEWCERRLLSRIHRYTLQRLRSEIEPVSLADYQRFLFRWQGLGSERREGRDALAAVLAELQGLALPAAVWEREVLPARIVDYRRDMLDQLCVAGELVWWRPRPSESLGRPTTIAASPIAIVPRAALAHWR